MSDAACQTHVCCAVVETKTRACLLQPCQHLIFCWVSIEKDSQKLWLMTLPFRTSTPVA
jgi:type II secretory pathway component PulL